MSLVFAGILNLSKGFEGLSFRLLYTQIGIFVVMTSASGVFVFTYKLIFICDRIHEFIY